MGSECNNLTDEERAKFHLAFHGAKDIIVERLLNPILLIPTIWRFHPKKRQMEACLKIVYEISFKMIDNYRLKDSQANSEKSTSNSNATVDSDELIEIGIKPFESIAEKLIKSGNSNNRIATEICTLLVTGHETLASAFQFLLFALARNPKYQEACRKEIDELLATKDNQSMEGLSMSDLSKLKYLKRCILESLRLYPTVPTFIRRLDSPLDIGNGYKLETGKSLMVMPWVVHRNPEIYPDPETFDPDRFLLENIQKRHSHAFLPFSLGPRNCLGYKIALLEIKIFMVEILRNFYVTTTDKPEDVKIQFDITLKPERPFNIYFTRREI